MKYIISENRIMKIVSTFLDQYDWYEWDSTGDGDLYVYLSGNDNQKIFYTIYSGESAETGEPEYNLIINYVFFNDLLKGFFGDNLNPMYVVKWFNKKFSTNCIDYDFFEPEEDN